MPFRRAVMPAILGLLLAGCATSHADLTQAVQAEMAARQGRNCDSGVSIGAVKVRGAKVEADKAQATAIVTMTLNRRGPIRLPYSAIVACLAFSPPDELPWAVGETKGVAYSTSFEKSLAGWKVTSFKAFGTSSGRKIEPWRSAYE